MAFDRQRLTLIGHGIMPWWNPVSEAAVDRLGAELDLAPGRRVLDVGCGRGGMLIRLLEASGAAGAGVDANAAAIARARASATARLAPGQSEFHAEPFDPARFAAATFDAALCVGSTHAMGGLWRALTILGSLTSPAGRLLIGEGFWRQEPAAAYLEHIGGTPDEMTSLAGTAAVMRSAGFGVARIEETTDAEWDRYERGYLANVEAHAAAHPDDPEALAMRVHVRAWHDGYLRWGRDTMGFALFLLRR
jgi:SAM-dependent methyltransferase